MARIRYAYPGFIYEVSTRTIDGMHLLRPSGKVNAIILGVIGRAQKNTGIRIHGMAFAATHYHMLLGVDSTEQMSTFMRLVNADITKKLNDLRDRTGTSWAGRFHSILVTDDPETQESRLRYLLAHGVKERLVRRVEDWPAISMAGWLLRGEELVGVWTDFTARYYARRRKSYVPIPGEFDERYAVHMTVLPCWAGLTVEECQARAAEMVRQIEAEVAPARAEDEPSAEQRAERVAAVLAVDFRHRVKQQKHSDPPLVLCVFDCVRERLEKELWAIFAAYRESAARFRAGEWDVAFPGGTFRPGGGFVPVT